MEVLGENSESFENKIALCRDCHKEYDEHKTIEKYNAMLNLKKKLLQNNKVQTVLSHDVIEKELLGVVQQISSLSTNPDSISEMEPLSYTVMSIKAKIPSNNLLRTDVEGLVSSYFLYLKDLFKNLDEVSFETIAASFKHSYCQALKEKLDQEEIFESLIDWVKSKHVVQELLHESLFHILYKIVMCMEKYPDKLYSVPESVVGIMLQIIEMIPDKGILLNDLKELMSNVDTNDFIDALTCLYAIQAIKYNSFYFIEKSC